MKNIILQVKTDSVVAETIANVETPSLSIWFWVALAEFIIITLLILKTKKKQKNLEFGDIPKGKMKAARNSNVDMGNLMNSINSSKQLYKELSRACHPDRFINSEKQVIAEHIFQEISDNKRDFNKLTALKQRAKTELNINLK